MRSPRFLTALLLASLATSGSGQEPTRPRPGLTALQTQQAVRIAGVSLEEGRKKADEPAPPDADRRQYVVSVERQSDKSDAAPGDRAVVTIYRYADDTTVYSVVDLASGKAVDVQTARHMRTPLSDGEFQAAKDLAREKLPEVRELLEKFGDRVTVYPQFSQYKPENEDRVHRVVHVLYRVDKRDLSAPRPVIDLTTRTVRLPDPDRPASK